MKARGCRPSVFIYFIANIVHKSYNDYKRWFLFRWTYVQMICGRQYSEPFTTLYLIAAEIKSVYSNFKLTVIYFVALYHCS